MTSHTKTNRVPCFVLRKAPPRKVTPSIHKEQLLQTSDERLEHMSKEVLPPQIVELLDIHETSHHKVCAVPVGQALFQPSSNELIFQNFILGQTYQLPLQLWNLDLVPRHVRVEMSHSDYFRVDGPQNLCSKVVPGLHTSFTVFFSPKENKDYHHCLVGVTERERFVVNIRAIGPRAILTFRDELQLPECLVKDTQEKSQWVQNIGNAPATFQLYTESPFSVTPSSGRLDVGKTMCVSVVFSPKTIGEHSQDMRLHYNTGEDVYMRLCGVCKDIDARLVPSPVTMEGTFVSLSSASSVCLSTSSPPAHLSYRWTSWASEQEEENASRECGRQDVEKITSCFTIEPEEDRIYTNRPIKFCIFFKPEEVKFYEHTMYLDITGCEARLPLKVMGQGLGPRLLLDYNLFNMGEVTMDSTYYWEQTLSNIGQIDAHFMWSSPDTTYGRCFGFHPDDGDISVGKKQALNIMFNSGIVGAFSEDLLLTVRGQPQPLTLTVTGHVIGPTFHFNISELNFGNVAFGFPHTLTCDLVNTSEIKMSYTLRVLGDGHGPVSVVCDKQLCELALMRPDQWQGSRDPAARPVEFTVSPASGTLNSGSSVTVEVTLCSNTVKNYSLALAVDVKYVGKEVMTLPINARCVVPELIIENPLLDYHRCFLNHHYTQSARITNKELLPACYGLLDQLKNSKDSPVLLFSSPQPCGVVPANSSVDVPISVLVQAVGMHQRTANITVFGSTQAPLEVALTCIGQGPVVYIPDSNMDFGDVPVCKDISRTLKLINQSPIPAQFTASVAKCCSVWRVEPSQGEVPPEGQQELRIIANLKDILLYQGRLDLAIHNNKTQAIPLLAKGIGTTIFSEPPLQPSLDLGVHVRQCQFHFTLTNHGKRLQQIKWVTEDSHPASYFSTKRASKFSFLPPIAPSRNGRQPSKGCRLKKLLFSISPVFFSLAPGASADIVLSARSDSPKMVCERLECFAMIESCSYERIMAVNVTCQFITPVITVSPEQLSFCATKVSEENLVPQYQKMRLKNASCIALTMDLSLSEPFSLCDAPGHYSTCTTKALVLGGYKETDMWVCFNPGYYQDQMSHEVHEVLQLCFSHHPMKQSVYLSAEVHFPNLQLSATSLDFGCVLNSTQTRRSLTITNCSVLPVEYRWSFLLDHNQYNIRCLEILQEDDMRVPEMTPVAVQNVFDIDPFFGNLLPEKSQVVTFTFFGHANISGCVLAQCRVKEGPIYEVVLRGEASQVLYDVGPTHIDLGLQVFDLVAQTQLILRNQGKGGFTFNALLPNVDEEEWDNVRKEDFKPGRPLVVPATGYVEAGQECVLCVHYLPGVPEVFNSSFLLQVAHLPAQNITLTGTGIFPRILLDLPLQLLQEGYTDLIVQAKAVIEESQGRETDISVSSTHHGERAMSPYTPEYDELLHMEMERRLVSQNALAVMGTLMKTADGSDSFSKWRNLSRVEILEYALDFGDVTTNEVYSHTVKITNPGPMAVSLQPKRKSLAGTGFDTEFYKVRNLPCGETHTFTVTFEHRAPCHAIQKIYGILPIQVFGGPTVQVKLSAMLIMPALTVSKSKLKFDRVQCGMCQVITIQLWNHESVPCQWSIADKPKPSKQNVFEMEPSSGYLHPGDRINVQVRFRPAEERRYSSQLVACISQSTQSLQIAVQGQGEEPRLVFGNSSLDMGPCQPYSPVDEAEIIVKNPCRFPIEFYSLEFDTQYLEEEKILRLIKGYDTQNTLLLPPRAPGETLPPELLEYGSERHQGNHDKMDMDPVSSAQARYRSSHMSPKVQPAPPHHEPGVALIVHGAPLTDKTRVAAELARYYRGACLTLDAVVTEALIGGTSPACQAAQQIYQCVATEHAMRAQVAAQTVEELSVETPDSMHDSSGQTAASSRVPEMSEDAQAPASADNQLQFGEIIKQVGDVAVLKSLIPEQLLVEILAERLQLADCLRSVVMDGLESVYCRPAANTLQVMLKAFGKRKHLYLVDLRDTHTAMKERGAAQKEAEEARDRQKEDTFQEIDDAQYDALLDEEQQEYDRRFVHIFMERSHMMQKMKKKEQVAPGLQKVEEEVKRNDVKVTAHQEARSMTAHSRKESPITDMTNKKKSRKGQEDSPVPVDDQADLSPTNADMSEADQLLLSQFRDYEQGLDAVAHILQHWDRGQAMLLTPLPTVEVPEPEKQAINRKRSKTSKKKQSKDSVISPPPVHHVPAPEEEEVRPDSIPHLVYSVTGRDEPSTIQIVQNSSLPPLEEVVGSLDLTSSISPIPPPVSFSVVPFPKVREECCQLVCDCFTIKGTVSKDWDTEDSEGTGATSDTKTADPSSSLAKITENADTERLTKFRWVVPGDEEVKLKICFQSSIVGQFEQTLNFEIFGTQKCYKVLCRGVCCIPSINTDYKTIFANTKMVPCVEDGLQKTYVIKPGYFDFGPLLCGKTRDGFKRKRFMENVQSLVIHNNSVMKVEIQFCFETDIAATTFILEPPTMTLKPDKKKELLVWAYPTSVGRVEDRLMCFIKDNSDHVTIQLACTGVIPKLEMDTKHIHFDGVLQCRPESRTLTLHNRTALSVAWKFRGVEELGMEFTVSHAKGVIPPNSSFCVGFHFKALKLLPMRKPIHLEVSDTDNILGIVATECLLIETKVHDVCVAFTFPDSINDNSLDFGNLKICDENKQRIQLTNNGKFEIKYKFLLVRTSSSHPDPASLFKITPQQGSLKPTLSYTIYIEFNHGKELCIRQQTILRCQITDPGVADGVIVGDIPINVSVRSLFSRYSITPDKHIDFGPMKSGSKSSQTFTIKNEGEFKTNFQIVCQANLPASLKSDGTRVSSESRSYKQKPKSLNVGMFMVSPTSGVIQPGAEEVITVGCQTKQLGIFKECLTVDISGRDPTDQPEGIAYYLLADVCLPEIGLDYASIFDEYYLCKSKHELSSKPYCDADGVFIQEDKTFVFNGVHVGRIGHARFKITNVSKLPCVFKLSIMPDGDEEIFMVSPDKLSIDGQSHSFAKVTFSPLAIQLYQAVFEASLDDTPSILSMVDNKDLRFQLAGQGNFPDVSVVQPARLDSQGKPLLAFRSLLVGLRQTLPLVLRNNGTVVAKVYIDMQDKQGVFTLKTAAGNACTVQSMQLEAAAGSELQETQNATVTLNLGQQAEFEVSFSSQVPLSATGRIVMHVEGSPYKINVQLLGEAYQGMISLDNISRPSQVEQEGDFKVLDFGHCHMGTQRKEHFIMTNHSKSAALRFEWPSTCSQVSFSPKVGHLHAGCSKQVIVTFSSKNPVTLSGNPLKCKICQVEFCQPLDQVADWDDSERTVWWPPTSAGQDDSNKVLRTRAEPAYSVVAGSQKDVELRICAVCDYTKFSCNTEPICFKDTMLFHNRIHHLDLVNKGNVKLEYSWNVLMDTVSDDISNQNGVTPSSRPVSRASRPLVSSERPSSALARIAAETLGDCGHIPFRVEPSMGSLEPAATLTFKVHFTPREVSRYHGTLVCSIPNLQDGVQPPRISMCGDSLLPACHFMLEDSDYLTGNRRSTKYTPLDPNTRVVEFCSIGCATATTRRFHVLNPTSKACTFQWGCVDQSPGRFRCLTPNATILPGKQQAVCFEYAAAKPGVEESLWSFQSEAPPLSIPFLLVGSCREPHLYLDKALLNMGSLHVGIKEERTVYLVNAEDQPYSFCVLASSLLSDDQQCSLQVVPKKGRIAPKERLSLSFGLTISTEGPVTFNSVLKVKGKTQQLALKVMAEAIKRATKPAASLRKITPTKKKLDFGMNGHVALDRDILFFGAVNHGAKATRTLTISNTGVLRARCCWDVKAFPRGLSIVPDQANVHPGKEMVFNLSYVPVDMSQPTYSMHDIISCFINKTSSALTATVTGFCIPPSAKKEVVGFLCMVRSSQVKSLAISNPSKERWTLKPLIEGEYWSATPTLTVEPSETATYNVTYRPLTMAPEDKKHQGSVCVYCPDGTVLLYVLQGAAVSPTAEDKLTCTVPTKTPHTQILDVYNWLPKPQRFHVLMEMLEPANTELASLNGLQYIDVPALKTVQYQICFSTYKEGKFKAKVTFCNKETGEYLFYLLYYKASSSVLSSVKMETFVRQPVWSSVEVENPLATPVSLTTECKSTNITIPLQQTVPALSKATITFMYQPLHAGHSTERLTLCSKELGDFQYDLHLAALPAPLERPLLFRTPLGCSHTLQAKFTSYGQTPYTCKVDSPEFSVTLPPNNISSKDMSAHVCFEPHQLGECKGHLKVSSKEGGEYVFPLQGTCVPPQPQGPITVTTDSSSSIPFKNVFLHSATFSYQVDNPCFTVEGKTTIESKGTAFLKVSFNAPAEYSEYNNYGRLTISTTLFTGHGPCFWVYFLKGSGTLSTKTKKT